jgi:hypothetical protein
MDETSSTDDIQVEVTKDTVEPVQTEQTGGAEDTAIKNDAPTPEAKAEEGKGGNVGAVIEKLGNDKKAAYEDLMDLAMESEVARDKIKAKIQSDPSMEKYVKSKFGTQYDQIMSDKPVTKTEGLDLEKIREEERIKARAELIEKQIVTNRDKYLDQKAVEFGFNADETEKFKKTFDVLSGVEADEDAAARSAARVVNDEKVSAKPISHNTAGGGEAPAPVDSKIVKVSAGLAEFAKSRGIELKEFAREIATIQERSSVDNKGVSVLSLPPLKDVKPE